MVGRAPGLLRDDTWTHLKNLIERFQENQHAFFILPIVRVQWESDNSSPPKKVDSKVKIEEIEVKAENCVKKENEKQVNCKASSNDSLNDGFDYLNDLDLDDIERKPTEPAQTDTFDFASDDSELTELDGESIDASVMKTSQSKPRIVLKLPKPSVAESETVINDRPKTPRCQSRKRSNTAQSPPQRLTRTSQIISTAAVTYIPCASIASGDWPIRF